MTINEYKSKSGLTNSQLADLLDVSESSVEKYLMGDTASAAVAKRMANIGIEHPYRRGRVNSGNGVPTSFVIEQVLLKMLHFHLVEDTER